MTTSFKLSGEHNKRADDVEATIQRAKQTARSAGVAIDVVAVPTGTHVATVWPDGKVDVTWEGRRYA